MTSFSIIPSVTAENAISEARLAGPTLRAIKSHFRTEFKQGGVSHQVIENRVSMLNSYMKWCRLSDTDTAGREFGAEFDHHLASWCDGMRRDGKSPRTIQDRTEWLIRWRDLIARMSDVDPLPADFAGALREAFERSGISKRQLAAELGVSRNALRGWIQGKGMPTIGAVARIGELERALGLPDGALLQRAGYLVHRYLVAESRDAGIVARSAYGERMSKTKKTGWTRDFQQNIPQTLRDEWAEMVAFKTDEAQQECAEFAWRMKPLRLATSAVEWQWRSGDYCVPTAKLYWSLFMPYFAWLCLAKDAGGAGLPIERVNSLGMLMNDTHVSRYLKFNRMRAGDIAHGGLTRFQDGLCILLRRKTGWLWQNPQVAYTVHPHESVLSIDAANSPREVVREAWQAKCEALYEQFRAQRKKGRSSKKKAMSRDPKDPISEILALDRPLSSLMAMFAELKAARPSQFQPKRLGIWARDVLLFGLLAAVPLRVGNLTTMTYQPDNKGNLYRSEKGWSVRFPSLEIKNGKPYDVALPAYVCHAIEEYLRTGRSCFPGHDQCDYVFLSLASHVDVDTSQPILGWAGDHIAERIRHLTRCLRPGKPAFGPHAFRHIVASDYLKRYPGAYNLVAYLLNDSLETVIAEYGHISANDGLRLHYQSVEEELRRVAPDLEDLPGTEELEPA